MGDNHGYMQLMETTPPRVTPYTRDAKKDKESLIVTTHLEEMFMAEYVYKSHFVCIKDKDTLANLVLLMTLNFDVILRMDCPVSKEVMSNVATREMSRQEGLRCLAKARDALMDDESVDYVQVVCENLNVFPDELLRLPSKKKIEFYIDWIIDMKRIYIPLHRMAPAKLKELKE
ncbi:uncharacterized protein LOC110427023 [Herrania umbratica]|uniref:Uncharacterized protein LOC110427023 n=1 Tax=Herrania umbratica TaxID=108875 RepID=A0A6J1BFI3_9ROSI|nr:uncharacterized protein LOC110427023 [Herrania umbratica]